MTELPTLPLSPLETPDEAWTPGLLQLLTEPPGLHVDLGIAVTMKPHLPGDCRIDSYQQGSSTYSAKPDLGKCILWELVPPRLQFGHSGHSEVVLSAPWFLCAIETDGGLL